MIPAHDDRQLAGIEGVADAVVYCSAPGRYFGEMAVSVLGRFQGIGRSAQISQIVNDDAEMPQRRIDSRNPQRFRPHGGAATARADIGRCADQSGRGAWINHFALHDARHTLCEFPADRVMPLY